MPILGREGESISTRLFGKNGITSFGEGIKNLASGKTTIAGRISQGLSTPGGFLNSNSNKSNSSNETTPSNYGSFTTVPANTDPSLDQQIQKLNGTGSGTSTSSADSEQKKLVRDNIVAGWDDYDKSIDKAMRSAKKLDISSIDAVSKKYRQAQADKLSKTKTAIAGNKELITRNQRTALEDLAGDTEKSMRTTNNTLGMIGAGRGSSRAYADRLIAEDAGKTRKSYLTNFGDQQSGQTQELSKSEESYQLGKEYIDGWEKEQKKLYQNELRDALDTLSKLKKSKNSWKNSDLKTESNQKLQKALQQMNEVTGRANELRSSLYENAKQIGLSADEIDNASIDITAPAELQTPDYNAQTDFSTDTNSEDYFDPTKQVSRKVVGTDALGNPIYEDEVAQ